VQNKKLVEINKFDEKRVFIINTTFIYINMHWINKQASTFFLYTLGFKGDKTK